MAETKRIKGRTITCLRALNQVDLLLGDGFGFNHAGLGFGDVHGLAWMVAVDGDAIQLGLQLAGFGAIEEEGGTILFQEDLSDGIQCWR